FDPQLQAKYRAWAKQILNTRSPYSGLTLAQDPAVGIVEIVNEDSFFFWTFTKKNVPPAQWQKLEGQFAQWLQQRYGSLDKALTAGRGSRLPDDHPASGAVGLYEAWDMTSAGLKQGGHDKTVRVGDQVRFLTELQRNFYAATAKYFKDELR